ncbi:mediator of RNA polymerase II transcription subunit 15 isoform X2 [Parasteatoda tepidariorum]|uniref:mediator of RNA polymerase II transcription subunit 15 isoform X2 n=1 Tax=Parasteatoda tepidariorum TaxID=114398 RepID=UPI000A2C0CF9|nr:mediator of RNA polymerase II transcription subunit 15 isoform X2 [Parasteatoda tepidariorum]
MENMADSQELSWRSQSFRQNVRAKIEEAIRQSGNPTQKSVPEMETHVFQKAKSKEEYLGYVARLIIHVREMNSKKSMTGPVASSNMGPGGGVGQPSDPMSALKSMAGQGSGTVTIQSQPGQTQMTASLLGSGGTISQMPTPPQPQQIQVQSMGSGINPASGPNVVPQSINPQGMNPMVMQPTRFLGPGNVMNPQSVQPRQMMAPNVLIQKFRQQGPPPNVTSTNIGCLPNQGPNSNQSAVPSPASHHPQSLGPQMVASPAVYGQSPNPQIAPSPAGSYNVRTPGAPSPGSALNTPIPSGPTASPINRTQEDCYLEKRKQLAKYVEPLKRMISRIEKDENKKKDLSRMKSLYDILTDPNKRCPMDVLIKCEQVLEKMNPSFLQMDGITPPAQPTTVPMKSQEQNICQPLIDALNNISKSPMFNHILEKTFGPPITALFGSSVRTPSPPPKRRKADDDSAEISDVLQGEIARLDQKFKVQLDPVQHQGSKTVNLICQLDDKNLPCVPSISITVPENYPEKPPQCYTTKDEYESTSILQSIQQVLCTRLSTMPQKYSITSLLDTWEMSVRQACASKPIGVES